MPWWFRRRRRSQSASSSEEAGRVVVGGRRYVVDAPYILPKDLGEINRLDFQHYMLRYFLRGNFVAPVRNPRDILDVGSGTGRWAVQMSQQFPRANIFSLDIEPPQAAHSAIIEAQPENCVFVQGNVLQGLPFPDGSFDFVHQRLLVGAIPATQWHTVVRELARVTRPGGWIELIEPLPVPNGGPALEQVRMWMTQATQMRGLDITVALHLGELLQDAGLRRIAFRELPIPIGHYGGRLGVMAETQYDALLSGFRPIFVARGMTDEDTFDRTMQAAHAEIAQGRYFSPYYVGFGQRV